MFQNWKTSIAGVAAVVFGLYLLIEGKGTEALATITTGIGLITAKDQNK